MTKDTVYTDDVVADMTEAYTAVDTDEARADVVQEFADQLGVKVQSVRAKLVNLGVYVAKARTAKNGAKVESKADIVREIAAAIDANEEVLDSLEKANKVALKLVRDAVVTKAA